MGAGHRVDRMLSAAWVAPVSDMSAETPRRPEPLPAFLLMAIGAGGEMDMTQKNNNSGPAITLAEIISGYVRNNHVAPADLSVVINTVYKAIYKDEPRGDHTDAGHKTLLNLREGAL